MWIYFQALCSVALSGFMPLPCCFEYYSFVVQSEVQQHTSSFVLSFSRLLWQFAAFHGFIQILGLFKFQFSKNICLGYFIQIAGLDMITSVTFLPNSMWILLYLYRSFLQVSSSFLVRIIPHIDIFLVRLLGEVSSESSRFTILTLLRNSFFFFLNSFTQL